MKNKSGSFSVTLSWFAATIIVFFIVLGGLFFEGTIIATKKSLSSDNKVQFNGIHDAAVQREFVSFLNSEINFDGKDMRVVDLIADRDLKGNEKYFEEFQKQGNTFLAKFSEWKLFSTNGFDNYNSIYGASFIRIYDSSEKVTKDFEYGSKYTDYESSVSSQVQVGINEPRTLNKQSDCNPDSNSVFMELFISKDKHIALCAGYI